MKSSFTKSAGSRLVQKKIQKLQLQFLTKGVPTVLYRDKMEGSTRSRVTPCAKPPGTIDFTESSLAGKCVVLTNKEDWSDPLNGNTFKLEKEHGRRFITEDVFRDATENDIKEDIVVHGGMRKVCTGETNFVRVYWVINKGENNKLQDSVVPRYVPSDKYWAQSAPDPALAEAGTGAVAV